MLTNARRAPFLAATVALAVTAFTAAPCASIGNDASLGGRVLRPDGITPREGVRVGLVDDLGELRARSLPTRTDGAFLIEGAPQGNFAVVVEAPEGAFVSGTTIDLGPGSNPALALSLRDRTMHYYEETTGLGSNDPPMARWARWVVAGSLGLVALLVVADQSEDESESAASPF